MQHLADFLLENEYERSDNDKIEVSSGSRLKLVPKTGQEFIEDCADDTDWNYDADLAEFAAGQAQAKNLTGNATLGIKYDSSIDGNWGGGVLTGNAAGNAAIVGNKLDLSNDDVSYVDYDAVDNADSIQKGSISFIITPKYSGTPFSDRYFFAISKGANDVKNLISIRHSNSGAYLRLHMYDKDGNLIVEHLCGTWSPTIDVPEKFRLNWDLDLGVTELFRNEVKTGTTFTGTGTRDSNIGLLRIGSNYGANTKSLYLVSDVLVCPTPQAADFEYTVPEFPYAESRLQLPSMAYLGIGSVQSWTNLETTISGAPRATFNGSYWNGAAWATTSNTYASAASFADSLANLGSLPAADLMQIDVHFPDSVTQAKLDTLTLSYTGQEYTTTDPNIRLASVGILDVYDILSIAYNITTPAGTSVGLICMINGVKYWYNASNSAWESADLTLAKSNTDLSILTPTIMQALIEPNVGNTFTWILILHSNDGSATPEITSFTTNYIFHNQESSAINECVVWFYVRDLLGDIETDDSQLVVEGENAFWHSKRLIKNYYRESNVMGSDGWIQLSVIETATVEQNLQFYLKYTDPNDSTEKRIYFLETEVPDQSTVEGEDLLVVDAA